MDPVEDEEDVLLPTRIERANVAEGLADLVAAGDWTRFVGGLLVEPSARFFPETWTPSRGGVRRVTRRLLRFAGIEDVRVEVDLFEPTQATGERVMGDMTRPDVLKVDVAEPLLADAVSLVAALAREVAMVYRARRNLDPRYGAADPGIVDVTAVYLGFGILLTRASYRAMTVETGGARMRSVSRIKRQGALGPKLMGYALAMQVVVRGLDKKERAAVGKWLEHNQGAFYRAAIGSMERAKVLEWLKLPAPDTWPTLDPTPFLAPLPVVEGEAEEDEEEDDAPVEDKGVVGKNEGKPVFRVRKTMSVRLIKMVAPVLGGGLYGVRYFELPIPLIPAAVVALGIGLVAALIGSQFRDDQCSEPLCRMRLKADATVCPRCGGTIAGEIAHELDRLEAHERLDQEASANSASSTSSAGADT